jgi:hypothetical protein
MRIAVAAVALFTAVSAGAVTIVPGDIADGRPGCMNICVSAAPPPLSYVLDHDTHLKATVGGYITTFGPNGHLFVSAGASITEYDTGLAAVRTFIRPNGSTNALTIAQNSDVYALASAGVLTIYSPAGAVKQTITLPFAGLLDNPPSLDLGADQCTLFYTDGAQTGRRFDVCAVQPLPDLAPGPWKALRAMSDGGYVVAAQQSTLSIFDAHNHLLRNFTPQIDPITALAFDIDPQFVWAGTTATLAKINLSTGAVVASGGPGPSYLAVNGEQRPAAAPLAADIPLLSPSLLLALALGLILLALQRLRA